jgi:hypothetical protein
LDDSPLPIINVDKKALVDDDDIELMGLIEQVQAAPTRKEAEEIINQSGGWKVALKFRTKEILESKK